MILPVPHQKPAKVCSRTYSGQSGISSGSANRRDSGDSTTPPVSNDAFGISPALTAFSNAAPATASRASNRLLACSGVKEVLSGNGQKTLPQPSKSLLSVLRCHHAALLGYAALGEGLVLLPRYCRRERMVKPSTDCSTKSVAAGHVGVNAARIWSELAAPAGVRRASPWATSTLAGQACFNPPCTTRHRPGLFLYLVPHWRRLRWWGKGLDTQAAASLNLSRFEQGA